MAKNIKHQRKHETSFEQKHISAGPAKFDSFLENPGYSHSPIDKQIDLLGDNRIPASSRQKLAGLIGSLRGNQYIQRIIEASTQEKGSVQRDDQPQTIEDKLKDAVEGWGTDEDAIFDLAKNASDDEKRAILANSDLMEQLRDDLDEQDLLKVAKYLVDVAGVPAGIIQDAIAELALSSELVDRNTTLRIVNGDVTAGYIDDLQQPPLVELLVLAYGNDPRDYTLYYLPGTDKVMMAQKDFTGFQAFDLPYIFGLENQSIDVWKKLLVHETNHARNPASSTPFEYYRSEFAAFWVADYRNIEDLDQRALKIKNHILQYYPHIKAAYDTDIDVKIKIDNYTRPFSNVTNE